MAPPSIRRSGAPPVDVLLVELSRSPSYGGTKRVVVNLADALDPTRFRPRVLFYRDGPWARELEASGVAVTVLPAFGSATPGMPEPGLRALDHARSLGVTRAADGEPLVRPWRQAVSDVLSWWRWWERDASRARRLLPWVPDSTRLIHVNHSMVSDFSWCHVAARLGVPFIAHEHGIWKPRPAAYRRVATRAASVLCLTRERVARMRDLLGKRVTADFLPNGIPVDRLVPKIGRTAVRAALGVPERTPLLITAGHLQAWKGQHLAVEAAAALARPGLDFVWLLCGADLEPEYSRALRERVAEAGLEGRVRFLGERVDLPDLFAAADLAVHTSIQPEPFGLVVLEAMLQGCPVIGPREGGIPTLLEDGRHGRLVRPRDSGAIAETVMELIGDPGRRQAMGAAARTRVRECFDVRLQARRLEAIYERALAEHARRRG